MSFSKETKAELAGIEVTDKSSLHSLVYGMLLFSRRFSEKEITMTTESRAAAEAYSSLVSACTTAIVDMSVSLSRRGGDGGIFTLRVPDRRDCERLFDMFGHSPDDISLRINRANLEEEDSTAAFLRGVFLVCGSVNSPEKDYHLEFTVPYMNLAGDLSRLISEVEVISSEPNIISRKGSYVVYIKGSDTIADMLAYIGAPMASLEIVQQKIIRSVRNKVNRQTNSEVANSNKTALAAAKQIRAITVIKKKRGLSYLSDDLRELAMIRLENPEYNLRELGEALSAPISRSGVNHRLQRIMEIASELENGT